MSDNIVGSKLRNIRISLGKNVVEFGELVGWPTSKVSKVENGKQAPTVEELKDLCKKLNIPVANLIGESNVRLMGYQSAFQEKLRDKIKDAAEMYKSSDREEFKGSAVGKIITKNIPVLLTKKANINRERFLITGSIGKGQYAEIPWVSIFNRKITESATKGIYIVYLFTADMRGVYLSLNQGFTYFKEKFGAKKGKDEIEKMASYLRKNIYIPENLRAYYIDLMAEKQLGKGYTAGHITGKYYNINEMPSDEILVSDLLDMIEVYNQITIQIANRTPEQFYDYIVELNKGKVTEEVEFGTTDVTEDSSPQEYVDKPEERQEPVIDAGGKKVFLRNKKTSGVALVQANYRCETNNDHYSFKAKGSKHMYVEAHHLIPISEGAKFDYSTDVPANISSLCPNCHRCIHLGSDEEKEILISKLYDERKERLIAAGIFVSFEEIKKFYNI